MDIWNLTVYIGTWTVPVHRKIRNKCDKNLKKNAKHVPLAPMNIPLWPSNHEQHVNMAKSWESTLKNGQSK